MIEKMRKYSFVLYHKEYSKFLEKLQELGLVHIIRSKDVQSDSLKENHSLITQYTEAIQFIVKHKSDESKGSFSVAPITLLNQINKAREEKEALHRKAELLAKQIADLQPWGEFDYTLVDELRKNGLNVGFYHIAKNLYKKEWEQEYSLAKISENMGQIYFVVLSLGKEPHIEADRFSFHKTTLAQLKAEREEILQRSKAIDEYFENISVFAKDEFQKEIARLTTLYDYEDALFQADEEAEGHLRIISGFIPISKEQHLLEFVQKEDIIYFADEAKEEDNPPINLVNNRFFKLFEPITKMYMLPKYTEFDLTPFFAPFFLLFFGFCNADMGYGAVMLTLAFVLMAKLKDPAMKSYMSLVAFFGTASIIMGWVMGSVFGYDLKEIAFIGNTVPVRETSQIFNLGLLLGVIQILFGIGVSIIRTIIKQGFVHSLSTIGTFILIAVLSTLGAAQLGADISAVQPYLKYFLWAALALILLINKPGKNPLSNIGSGLWALYNIVSGFFGDILSYIRLFALGVSSSILGLVVNDIGAQMKAIPIAGPVVFILFMLFGHTLNLALGGLSGFVHPLRLTFIEFYNNAGFEGAGTEYKPFAKTIQ